MMTSIDAKKPPFQIDINCDLGEGVSIADCQKDADLMPYLSRCNIACGGHAGNLTTMRLSIQNARNHGLFIGAHPGYPDPENFGRLSLALTEAQLEETIVEQIDCLVNLAKQESVTLDHIKFHGALYNDLEHSIISTSRLIRRIARRYPTLSLMGLAGGATEQAAKAEGLCFISEGFIDRAYLNNGFLASRQSGGAVLNDLDEIIGRALALAKQQKIETLDEGCITILAESLCLHGDGENIQLLAPKLYQVFTEHQIIVTKKKTFAGARGEQI